MAMSMGGGPSEKMRQRNKKKKKKKNPTVAGTAAGGKMKAGQRFDSAIEKTDPRRRGGF